MERKFPETFNIYRGKAALQVSFSPELGLIFFNLAPAIPGMENKMPTSGSKKYQWERKLTVSFNFEGALEVAATAEALMQGKESLVANSEGNLPSWYRDPSKTGRQGKAKTLGFYRPRNQPQGSKVTYYLGIVENTKDKEKNKVGIPLEHADLFKIACVMKEAALALLGWKKDIEERKQANGHADKKPLTRPMETHEPNLTYNRTTLDKEQLPENEEIF